MIKLNHTEFAFARTPPGETKMPEPALNIIQFNEPSLETSGMFLPIIVPTINEMLPNRPTVRFKLTRSDVLLPSCSSGPVVWELPVELCLLLVHIFVLNRLGEPPP